MESEAEPSAVKSAGRALELIERLAEQGPATFTALVAELNLPRSSAHALLRTLEASGWIGLDAETRQYSLGLRAWQIGQRYDGHRDLLAAAQPVMDRLAHSLGETLQLARLDGVDNVYLGIALSPNPMRMASDVGTRLPSHATGIGKALLAQLDPREAERRLRAAAPLGTFTPHTVSDPDKLLALLDGIRRAGYAVDDEEYVEGCRCVAVPLTTEREGRVTSALSVTMPSFRTGAAWPADILAPLQDAVLEVRGALGLAPALSLEASA